MLNIHVACIISILLALSKCQTVPAQVNLDGLEVNSMTLTNLNNSQSQIYIHSFDQQFQKAPQVALGMIAAI
jgi:hypothetical protein